MTEPLRQLKRLTDSGQFSTLPQTEQDQWLRWVEKVSPVCAIEIAIINASAKQTAFMPCFFDRTDPTGRKCDIFAALGGNRSGKSFSAGWLCFALYLRDHARNGDWFWCIAQNLDRSVGGQQKELWNALPRWMFAQQTWDEKNGFGQGRAITLATADGGKCLVEFRSADQAPQTFEQAKLRGVWADERLSESIFGRLLSRIVDLDGWILYSDLYEQFWQFERLAEAKPEAGVYCVRFSMYDNAHNLPEGIIERRKGQMSSDEVKQKIEGELVVMEGIVYREYRDDFHAIEPFPKGIPATWGRYRAIDYGGSAPTACIWFALAPNECIYVYREFYQANVNIVKAAATIIEMSGEEKYVHTYIDPHAVDPPPIYYGAAKTIAQQYADAGIPTTGWPFINVLGEHACVNRVKRRLENGSLFIFNTCAALRREFRSWKYQLDTDGKPKASDAYEKTNNHALDCLKGFIATNPTFKPNPVSIDRRET